MGKEQFQWLEKTLTLARGAEHVFVFLHHPRWLRRSYGDTWVRVHELLVKAGNVSAVFAGHIHHMLYDGAPDGIEYFTLATTGGHLSRSLPDAGYLHQFHVVTVREQELSVACLPVGAVIDPRRVTAALSSDVLRIQDLLKIQP